jgi:hypothetical protein
MICSMLTFTLPAALLRNSLALLSPRPLHTPQEGGRKTSYSLANRTSTVAKRSDQVHVYVNAVATGAHDPSSEDDLR